MAAVVLVLAAVVAVTQSGGDDGEGGGVATGPPPGVTLDDLESALLTLGDLDDRYTVDTEADDGSDPMDDGDVDASPECLAAVESMESADESSEGASAAFVEADEGTIQHDIAFSAPGASLRDIRAGLEQCDVMTFDDEDASGEFRIDVAEFDDLGEDGFAMNFTAEFQAAGIDTGFEMYGVVWTRDGVVSTVTGFAGFDELTLRGAPADRDQVRELAALADERLAEVLAG